MSKIQTVFKYLFTSGGMRKCFLIFWDQKNDQTTFAHLCMYQHSQWVLSVVSWWCWRSRARSSPKELMSKLLCMKIFTIYNSILLCPIVCFVWCYEKFIMHIKRWSEFRIFKANKPQEMKTTYLLLMISNEIFGSQPKKHMKNSLFPLEKCFERRTITSCDGRRLRVKGNSLNDCMHIWEIFLRLKTSLNLQFNLIFHIFQTHIWERFGFKSINWV